MSSVVMTVSDVVQVCFFFQAEDGIRDLVRSRGLGDVYKRQVEERNGSTRSATYHRSSASPTRANVSAKRAVSGLSLIHI